LAYPETHYYASLQRPLPQILNLMTVGVQL